MSLRRLLKRVLIVAGLILIILVGIALIYVYPSVAGRIVGFQAIEPGIPLPGTNYTFEQINDRVVLKNGTTTQTMDLIAADGYKLLDHQGQLYLLTIASEIPGTAHALRFGVYNITTDTPHDLLYDAFDPQLGRSCTLPRLVDDALEFEIGIHCDQDLYLVAPDSEPHVYQVKLN